MAFNITNAAAELKEDTAWQKTPEEITDEQYETLIVKGIRRLLIDTGRALTYDDTLFFTEEDAHWFDMELAIDEIAYIFVCSKLAFFKRVQTDVNNIVSYSTDALKVTNADKPYAHLQDTVDDLENDRRILYYKMCRYTVGYAVSD